MKLLGNYLDIPNTARTRGQAFILNRIDSMNFVTGEITQTSYFFLHIKRESQSCCQWQRTLSGCDCKKIKRVVKGLFV